MQIGNESLDLKLTLIESAQCFSWRETSRGFVAVVQNAPLRLWRQDGALHAEGALSREEVRNYLDLDRDYGALAAQYSHIEAAKRAVELYPGLRMMNQSPWDALISFILSANNNVSRIRKLVDGLGRALGTGFFINGEEAFGMPKPEELANASEEQLRALGVGYRAPYLIGSARMVLDGFPLWQLKDMPYEEAHAQLTKLPGVGDKVADCVLLFGCAHASAFPVDVWVERLLKSWFGVSCKNRREMTQIARRLLGENAGLLQQFLFHAARMGDIELSESK